MCGGGGVGVCWEPTCKLLFSRDSSSAVASSAAFVSVDGSRYTIILAAAPKGKTGEAGAPGAATCTCTCLCGLPASRCGMELECLLR